MENALKKPLEWHLKAARFHLRELEKYDGLSWDVESKTASDTLERKAASHQKCYEKHAKFVTQLRNPK
jgi:hypothetical protein